LGVPTLSPASTKAKHSKTITNINNDEPGKPEIGNIMYGVYTVNGNFKGDITAAE
jgi:hypothetical protein